MRFIAVLPASVLFSSLMVGCSGSPEDTPTNDEAASTAGALPGAVFYPAGRTHSPISRSVAERLKAIAASAPKRDDRVFSKIGDSQTVNAAFMGCFAKPKSTTFDGH